MEKKKLYIIGGIIAGIGVTFYLIRSGKRKKALREILTEERVDNNILPQPTEQVKYSNIFPLRKGSGYDSYTVKSMVKNVQRYINQYSVKGTQLISIDGLFGERTEKHLFALTGKKEVSKEDYNKMI